MLNYFLSNNGFIVFPIIISIIILIPLSIASSYCFFKPQFKHNIFLTGVISSIILTMIGAGILASIKKDYISETNWKQIYTNHIDANVSIINSIYTNDIIAGKKLGDKYKFFTTDSEAEIKIEKDDTSYSKKIKIKKDNIIINGEINENSKITKLEYRNIQGVQKILFGHKGPIETPDIEGELRITIEQDTKQEELKRLFETQD